MNLRMAIVHLEGGCKDLEPGDDVFFGEQPFKVRDTGYHSFLMVSDGDHTVRDLKTGDRLAFPSLINKKNLSDRTKDEMDKWAKQGKLLFIRDCARDYSRIIRTLGKDKAVETFQELSTTIIELQSIAKKGASFLEAGALLVIEGDPEEDKRQNMFLRATIAWGILNGLNNDEQFQLEHIISSSEEGDEKGSTS